MMSFTVLEFCGSEPNLELPYSLCRSTEQERAEPDLSSYISIPVPSRTPSAIVKQAGQGAVRCWLGRRHTSASLKPSSSSKADRQCCPRCRTSMT
ncbi:hypothetical protein VTK56DRAFT_9211 [Thermocarpiscus australiensis]